MQKLPIQPELLTKFTFKETVCRLCMLLLTDDSSMEPNIFRFSGNYSIAEKITRVTRLNLFEGDGLPTTVCQQCIFKLDVADDFIQKCTLSNMSLQSKIISNSDCNLESNACETLKNQPMLTPPSDDFLLALEYIEQTQKTDANENTPQDLTELQVATENPAGDSEEEECTFFTDNFPEYPTDLDGLDHCSLTMEEFGELSCSFSEEDLDVGCCNLSITANDPQEIDSNETPHAFEINSETPLRDVTKEDILGSSENTSSCPENSSQHKCNDNQDSNKCKNVVVRLTRLPDKTSLCSRAVEEPETLSDPNTPPDTSKQPSCSGPNVLLETSPVVTRSEVHLLASQKPAAPSNVCDECSSRFASKSVLMAHKAMQACKKNHMKLHSKKSKLLLKTKVTKETRVNNLALDSNAQKRNVQSSWGAKVLTTTEPNLNFITPSQFRCTLCGLLYKYKHNLVKHTTMKHARKS